MLLRRHQATIHRSQYVQQHPSQADIALVIEVADSSISRDHDKCRLYARARIVAYWIVNLVDRRVEVYTDSTGEEESPTYRTREDFELGDDVPFCIEGQQVALVPAHMFFS